MNKGSGESISPYGEKSASEALSAFLEGVSDHMWGIMASASMGAMGMLAYMVHSGLGERHRKRMRENAAHSRRVKGPWRNSDSHCKETEHRLRILMRKTKRKDREAYVCYRDLRVASKRGDQDAYAKAVENYTVMLEMRRGKEG